MGCNDAVDVMCEPSEYPAHQVTVGSFMIDKTEVTFGAYQACVSAGVCSPAGQDAEGPRYPVRFVTWFQAERYCAWAGKRLATEAEWERAARGDDARVFPWGNASPTCELANFYQCGGRVAEVGMRPAGASPWGALDMSGNVWEWTQDFYGSTYYGASPDTDPSGPPSGTNRIMRGGYFDNSIRNIRSGVRGGDYPTAVTRYIGFRCAR